MNTGALKKFAQAARRQLQEQIAARLESVLKMEGAALQEKEQAINALKKQIDNSSRVAVIERVAYIWFNRFCALRFMDANRYTRIGAVSPSAGFTQPEILAEAKQGHIDEQLDAFLDRQRIFDLLGGRLPSPNPQQEAYRHLLVAVCNYYHARMPFLFEDITDYTELLMPEDLLSEHSVLTATLQALTDEACENVEVIGWLYQFYISEKKDEVFAALKKNTKVSAKNIPAATQLFTPHWIVRYLVENSLGRLWMLNHPESGLIKQMDYYIQPEQQETDFLQITSPEDIKICDPACGSGHMLVYAFDLLYAIYEEQGYDAKDIPGLILQNNLYGIEIDERAGELAAFALTMKAREKTRRFFRKPVQPNICVLEKISFTEAELDEYREEVGRDLLTLDLQTTLQQFSEADNFGSLIQPALTDVDDVLEVLAQKDIKGNIFLYDIHLRVLQVLRQADYLSPKYHVVIANPPYMGSKGMNGRLTKWAKDNYPNSKSDLFAMFMDRTLDLLLQKGYMGMINLPSWLFLSSFEKLRKNIITKFSIESMLHMGRGIFGIDWGSTAFVIKKSIDPRKIGHYFRLHKRNFQHIYFDDIAKIFLNAKNNPEYQFNFDEYRDEDGVNEILNESNENGLTIYYEATAADFKKIPGTPIAYWVSEHVINAFKDCPRFEKMAPTRKGMVTARNEIYVRYWYEVSLEKAGFDKLMDRISAQNSGKKWFSYLKGGGYRKWFGNKYDVINWENDGKLLQTTKHPSEERIWATNFNLEYIFKPNVNWGAVTSSDFSARISNGGELFDAGGSACFPKNIDLYTVLGFLNSKVSRAMLGALNPTLNFQAGNIANLPLIVDANTASTRKNVEELINSHKIDWDSYEISWDFTKLQLLHTNYHQPTLKATYTQLRTHWREIKLEMKHHEEENNRIFIKAYGLQDELTPELPFNKITLTCNPDYRYGDDKSEEELEALLLADTLKEFISYAVGCMFGRYSLDKPGLILANQGETLAAYLSKVPEPRFMPDEDNVIPILEEDWFTDDITGRFRTFLRITFGEDHYDENMAFIEQAIGKELRRYLVKDFYNDHVKRYKKRPIYWLFSSPAGSFNAMIYMHRYRSDTVSVVLNDYLREFRTKLTARKDNLEQVSISTAASQSEKTKALKEITRLNKIIDELEEWERDVLYPMATRQITIDLDDGVKVNYPKFAGALKKITGLS
jgi:type II restriction/modification system DNA methylase subunit YeeA